jgi:hypothetical protein
MKTKSKDEYADELRSEYDLSVLLKDGVRGRYAKRYTDRNMRCLYIVFSGRSRMSSLFSRIKLQTPVWRCSGSPEGSSYACRIKMPPAPAGGGSLRDEIGSVPLKHQRVWPVEGSI